MAVELATAYVSLTVSAKGIKADLDRELGKPAEDAANKAGTGASKAFGDSFSSVGGSLTKVGAASVAAAGVVGGALFAAAGSFTELALSAGKMADTTGLAVDDASRWTEVAGDMGIEAGTLESSLNKMNLTAGKTPEKFAEFGVEIARTKTGAVDVNQTFLNTIDRLNAIEDPAKKAEAATALLGKGWTGMSELIATGSSSLTTSLDAVSASKVIDPEELQKAKDMRAAMDTLKDAGEDLALSIGASVAPMISGLATTIGGAVQKVADFDVASGGMIGTVLGVGTAVLAAAGSISFIAGQALKMKDRFTDAEGGLNNFGKAAKGVGIAMGIAGVALAVYSALEQQAADNAADFKRNAEALSSVTGQDLTKNTLFLIETYKLLNDASPEETLRKMTEESLASGIAVLQAAESDKVFADELASRGVTLGELGSIVADETEKQKAATAATEAATTAAEEALGATESLNTGTSISADSLRLQALAEHELKAGLDEAEAATRTADTATRNLAAAHALAESNIRNYEAAWDAMTGKLNTDQAWVNLTRQVDDVALAATDAWTAQIEANEALRTGADDAVAKQAAAEAAQRTYQDSIADTKQKVLDLGKQIGLTPTEVETLLTMVDNGEIAAMETRLTNLARKRDVSINPVLAGSGFSLVMKMAEHGGPAKAGQPIIVGEKRPEVFVPNVDGYIMPSVPTTNTALLALQPNSSSAGNGPRLNIEHLEVSNDLDADGFFRMANFHMAGV